MHISRYTAIALTVAALSASIPAVAGQRERGPGDRPDGQPSYLTQSAATPRAGDANAIGRRLYRGVLGRDADEGGLRLIVADIQRGRLSAVVDRLLASDEFQSVERSMNASQLLDQFYRGLLLREPDSAGTRNFLAQMNRHQYAEVILALVNSPEFSNSLDANNGTAATTSRLDSAFACQFRVLELIRRDANGRVLVSFDRFPDVSGDGRTVRGAGKDRWVDVARDMTYSCTGGEASYRFADGRPAASPDPRLAIPSGSVRDCQNAVREGLVFDAASISGSDVNQDWILGLAGGATYKCRVEPNGRVTVIK